MFFLFNFNNFKFITLANKIFFEKTLNYMKMLIYFINKSKI